MGASLSILVAGLMFGFGLAVSGMTHAGKVLGFLDITGDWDPSLLFVLAGAVTVTAVAFRFVLRRPTPVLVEQFHLPTVEDIDRPLVIGAAIFGVGWGIAGYCPGPAIASLAAPSWETWVFIPCLLLGNLLHAYSQPRNAADSGAAALGAMGKPGGKP